MIMATPVEPPPAIEYHVQGQGETVVLLNGGMMSSFAWEPVAKGLAEGYRVVRFDFRGQLMTPLPEGAPAPDLSAHARDVVAILDRLGVPKAHLVGTSFGALVGLTVALEHPGRVASLVAMTAGPLLTPEMNEGTRRLRAAAQAALAGGDGGVLMDLMIPATYSPEWIAANQAALVLRRGQVASLPKAWFAGADAVLAAIEGMDLTPRLGKIQVPVVVVGAEKDLTFPVQHSRDLQRLIPGAKLSIVPGAPHGFVIEQPAAALASIREALATLGVRATPAPAVAVP